MGMKRVYAVAIFAAMLTLVACGSSGGGSAPGGDPARGGRPGQHGAATITIMDFGYAGSLTVRPGERVTVVNKDSTAHTLTDKATHLFDTGAIAGDGTGSFVAPMKPGKYPFGCTLHPEMSGVLTVTS
jgi:plastocyanin